MDEREAAVELIERSDADLEEDTAGAAVVAREEPLEVDAVFVDEVAVVGKAQRHRHVGGLVALDAAERPWHVDRQRDERPHDQQRQRHYQTGVVPG